MPRRSDLDLVNWKSIPHTQYLVTSRHVTSSQWLNRHFDANKLREIAGGEQSCGGERPLQLRTKRTSIHPFSIRTDQPDLVNAVLRRQRQIPYQKIGKILFAI